MSELIEDNPRAEGPGSTLLSSAPVECPPFLLEKASECQPMTMAVANATTPLVLESARDAHELGLIEPVLVGRFNDVRDAAELIDWDVSDVPIEFAGDEEHAVAVSVALAASGDVNGLMKGNVHTDVLMRAAVNRHSGLRTDRLMSHVFHMTVPDSDRALCITDAVLNVLPTAKQKAEIARNAVSLLLAIGYEKPKVALLSASETASSAMPSSLDAAELAQQADQGSFPNATVEGPMAFDLAVSEEAARIKEFSSVVAGNADILLVPNIETGNALFKMMVHFMSAAAAGIVLGAKVPIVLTSRADPVAARLASLALACIYADDLSRRGDR